MHGKRSLTTDTLDRIAPELDLKVEKTTENKTPSGAAPARAISFSVEKGAVANARKRVPQNQRKSSQF